MNYAPDKSMYLSVALSTVDTPVDFKPGAHANVESKASWHEPYEVTQFYNEFFAHKITIAPGDSLEVKLKIYQAKEKDTGIYTNSRYEVIEVHRHIPRMRQSEIDV